MKKLMLLLMFAVALLAPSTIFAQASTDPGLGSGVDGGVGVGDFSSGANEGTGLTSTLQTVARYALYVFYILGIIFMGVAAVKFKNGDMEAFGKNLGGAVCLFLVPKIVETILQWAGR